MERRYERTYSLTQETDRVNSVSLSVYYDKGGDGVYSGNKRPRGYHMSITPILIERRPGYAVRTWDSGNPGISMLLEPASRYSAKHMKELISKFDHYEERYLRDYCSRKGYPLSGEYTIKDTVNN